ncbi:MAG: hypothetical protein M1504_02230 [Candidatus Marsarchaeota archaeon]|nr:hypothetical protein [Candidatus Marsarchaeota archaeon]
MMELSEKAKGIIRDGSVKVRLKRSGMYQFQTFTVKRLPLGKDMFVELFLNKVVGMEELKRLANELGLPVEVENGKAFPEGTSANDFIGF